MLQEFRTFIQRGNVIDLAVGIIIGAAFTAIVSSLVSDLINPIIGILTGGVDFSDKYFVLSGDVPEGVSLDVARESGAAIFAYGSFLMAVVNFLIIAWVVFILVKVVNHMKPKETPKEEAPAGPTQEELLAQIRDLLADRTTPTL
ncbi:large conductance mechanosensitive channel protein MscL [Paracoccus sp. 1_MG-2023]|uniref:large conductance mechanosensitive channel protein MscL n=1 Tax=unclassified Paracoccus (in: a-proteobacteria) TaxID=2688777 RepID=UPI001C0A616F|nr:MULTISPECIES: large conductance mechanosensitive channel protein MscL [unclassified Paracoccus (in: a-proteobacteria)]MBU2956920.1 large conductance mechanosensitive channel protein MscL [Paracoccus sp. C2R09]MDO6668118.1 large conductance mechanosensitive channel protein MscL [Paracoccus sp. 1_MG-2023]